MCKKQKDKKKFAYIKIKKRELVENPDYDLTEQYKNANAEMSLQQSKRDQIITIYLAIFSFLIPFALSLSTIDWTVKGIIFLGVGIIGVLFGMIIVRYRVYKECYWTCCQALTVMMNYNKEDLDKEFVQHVYYKCLFKKGNKFIQEKTQKDGSVKKKFKDGLFFKSNMFSAETIHFTIVAFIASIIFGFGAGLVCPLATLFAVLVGCGVGLIIFVLMHVEYFRQLKRVYRVLIDDLDDSFNLAFSKAWFLHFYVNINEEKSEAEKLLDRPKE